MAKDISTPYCVGKDGIFHFKRRIPSELLDHDGPLLV